MSRRTLVAILVLAAMMAGSVAFAARDFEVRQKNRAFSPRDLQIDRGDVVRVINDDGELLHHAYVDSDSFHFDSGEQEPGSTTPIRFTKSGTFAILCAIHPKMRLNVTVR